MSHKRRNRRRIVVMPPRGLRPMLDAGQRRDLALAHMVNLDSIARNEADEVILWQVVGGVLTWSRIADRLSLGIAEMTLQVDLIKRLVDRYGCTGRVEFAGDDYDLAKKGTIVMDLLGEQTDRYTAVEAATWSEAKIERMAEEIEGGKP